MDLKNLIQTMDNLDKSENLTESVYEQGMNPGAPVSMNVSLNASGKEHVADLIGMMKNAGLGAPEGDAAPIGSMRNDMEDFRDMVDGPFDDKGHEHFGTDKDVDDPEEPGQDAVPGDDDSEEGFVGGAIGAAAGKAGGAALGGAIGGPVGAALGSTVGQIATTMGGAHIGDKMTDDADPEIEGYSNEPDEEYRDHKYMTKDLSGGINREKKMYKKASDGDNPMAVESIKEKLIKELEAFKEAKDSFDEAGCTKEMKRLDASGCSKNEMLKKVGPKFGCGKEKFEKLYASSCGSH